MRHLRQVLVMIALMAVALLPGPSHALAAATVGHHQDVFAAHVQAHHAHATHQHRTHTDIASADCDHHRPAPTHHPCKACSVACCAPAVEAASPRPIVIASMHRLRPIRPATDRLLAGALPRAPLKPPTLSA